ncbi:hypothetical protein ACKEQL_08440 [Acinetobacter baumannii]|uniref:hypothetical protein n=1 Tax=Acinetobacter baumannii TaxID=470 RepID=UPI0013D4C353|nr:hypothetical protein [Acinetobacter baumannii]
MWVFEMFPNDPMKIAMIQHDLYSEYLPIIFEKAKREYLRAEFIVGIETELGKNLREASRFDHRTIQEFHDVIAGKFRLNWVALKNQQFDLFEEPKPVSEDPSDVAHQWKAFLESELEAIFKESPCLVKYICIATMYANPDKRGCKAEDQMYEYIKRYKDCFSE